MAATPANRTLILSQLFGVAGMLCLAFGFLGLDGAGASIHPALADRTTALGLLACGAILVMVELRILIPALRERARNQSRQRP